jgi:hypothetical protein
MSDVAAYTQKKTVKRGRHTATRRRMLMVMMAIFQILKAV